MVYSGVSVYDLETGRISKTQFHRELTMNKMKMATGKGQYDWLLKKCDINNQVFIAKVIYTKNLKKANHNIPISIGFIINAFIASLLGINVPKAGVVGTRIFPNEAMPELHLFSQEDAIFIKQNFLKNYKIFKGYKIYKIADMYRIINSYSQKGEKNANY